MLDEATGRWGIRVNRVEVKAIDPPATIQEAMEKQMRAERDRRAAILTAEGSQAVRRSSTPRARSRPRCSAPRASKAAAILRAEGEAQAIDTVFRAIHEGGPDQGLLSYQYLQMLPQLAQGEANKIFVIPSEFSQALGGLASALGNAVNRRAAGAGRRRDRGRQAAAAGAAGRGQRRALAADERDLGAHPRAVARGARDLERCR